MLGTHYFSLLRFSKVISRCLALEKERWHPSEFQKFIEISNKKKSDMANLIQKNLHKKRIFIFVSSQLFLFPPRHNHPRFITTYSPVLIILFDFHFSSSSLYLYHLELFKIILFCVFCLLRFRLSNRTSIFLLPLSPLRRFFLH